MTFRVKRPNSRARWLAVRRKGVGASEAAAVLGVSPWQSRFGLYTDKIGASPDTPETDRMRWGHRLEAAVAAEYKEQTGRKVQNPGTYAIHWSDERPWMFASLDRITDHLGAYRVLEIKTSGFGADWKDAPPLHVQCQVQHQLAVTGWQYADVAVLINGSDFRVFECERNESFIDSLIAAERAFWHNHVLAKVPPEIDGSQATADALKYLHPDDNGETIALPPDAREWDERLQIVKEARKGMEAEQRLLENQLKAAIGGATFGEFPGVRYSYKTVPRKGFTVEPSKSRQLRRKAYKQEGAAA